MSSKPRAPATEATVLLTGFEPFGGDRTNPSMDVALALDGWQVPLDVPQGRSARVRGIVLPCVFDVSRARLDAAIRQYRPGLAIALGLAASRPGISVERVAVNLDDARIPDNAGQQPLDRPVRTRGPAAYWSTLPVKAVVAGIRQAGLPAEVSHSAGTFVCNHVFYGLADRLARMRTPRPRGGFIHLPPVAEQGTGMRHDDLVTAIRIAIVIALTHQGPDLAASGGSID